MALVVGTPPSHGISRRRPTAALGHHVVVRAITSSYLIDSGN
jgi:hypothetical protein